MPGSFAGIPLHRIGPLLAILGTILYLQTVSFDYTQDDAIVINDNMYTTKGVDGIGGLLSHDTFTVILKMPARPASSAEAATGH